MLIIITLALNPPFLAWGASFTGSFPYVFGLWALYLYFVARDAQANTE